MSLIRALALTICAALILSRVAGVHVHVTPEPPGHEHPAAVDHHLHATVVTAGADAHADRHAAHEDLDIDLPDTTAGKLPAMPWLAALACALLVLLLPRPGAIAWARAYRPPAPRRRTHLLPPPLGPPLAS